MPETIFMIHGMWGGPWCWNNFKDSFQRSGYHCVPAILRFHDMDPREPPDPRLGTTSLLDYAEDLEREIHELGVQPIVMGHSMGGAPRTDPGKPRTRQSPGPSYSCLSQRNCGRPVVCAQEFPERAVQMGILEETYASNV